MWYLPPDTNTYDQNRPNARNSNTHNICAKASTMLDYIRNNNNNVKLLDKCCQSAPYFTNKPK